jgi:DHA1 family bicyclomycin/chloramphenicol resistance-like MFS transporter
MTRAKPGVLLVVALTLISAAGPAGFQLLTPALPAIAAAFDASIATVQVAITVSLIATAIATPIHGLLADAIGRRLTIFLGFALYIAGSAVCALAPSVAVLIAGRALQGSGGASGATVARAIGRDVFGDERIARVIATVTATTGVLTIVAFVAGGAMTEQVGWRGALWLGVGFGVVVLLASAALVPRSPPRPIAADNQRISWPAARQLLTDRAFLAYVGAVAFASSTAFPFQALAPHLWKNQIGGGESSFVAWAAGSIAVFLLASVLAAAVSTRERRQSLIVAGALLQCVAAAGGILAGELAGLDRVTLIVPAAVMGIGTAFVFANAQAGALGVKPAVAGTASGVLGLMQLVPGAIAGQIAAAVADDTARPLYVSLLVLGLATLGCAVLARRGRSP